MSAAIERAIAELTLGPEVAPRDPAQVATWLDRNGVDEQDREFLLAGGIERLSVYRRLVRRSHWGVLELAIPRALVRLGPLAHEYFDAFLAAGGSRSHYLRDVTVELLDFCEPRWAEDERVPAYMMELARHEALHIEIAAKPAKPPDQEPGELALDRGVRFIEAVKLMSYGHRIHELSEDAADRTEPASGDTHLLVYRSPEHEVRYLELTPLAHEILRGLIETQLTLQDSIVGACQAAGEAVSDNVVQGVARVLADLADRGALLGARH